MNFKWLGPLALLAALVIGDQIRINRPAHKYRLTVEVERSPLRALETYAQRRQTHCVYFYQFQQQGVADW